MNVNINFSWQRLYHLILNDLSLNKKLIAIVAITLTIFCIVLPFSVTTSFTAYYLILFIGGFIVTGSSFNQMHSPLRAYQFLMLPCSNIERFLSKWLLTSIGYALGVLVVYYIISTLGVVFDTVVFEQQFSLLDITQFQLWHQIILYIVLQSFILLGAVYFKKYSLIKTAFVIGCLLLVFFVYTTLVTKIIALNYMQAWLMAHSIYSTLLYFLSLTSLYVAYLKVTEYELK